MSKKFHRQFLHFIKENQLFNKEDKVLLAVSGGVDSVVVAHLFSLSRFNFSIAHCNFGLREEARADEDFVVALAEKLQVISYVKKFDTQLYAQEKMLSIQMAARELRYNWFHELIEIHNFTFIATAHHKNDVAETILLNLTKGAVLSGLRGILPKYKKVVRPLLWAEKDWLISYASSNNIDYREDHTNADIKYARNKIRHKTIPELQNLNPNLLDTLANAAFLRSQINNWWQDFVHEIMQKCRFENENFETFSISKIKELAVNEAVLYEYFSHRGFSAVQMGNLVKSFSNTETKTFDAGNFSIVKDRSFITLISTEKLEIQQAIYIGKELKSVICGSYELKFEKVTELPTEWPKVSNISYIDATNLAFPLTLRIWQAGDYFIPFGMKGRKNISDFLTDEKVSAIEKKQQFVLFSGENIVWLIGRRTDERFKVEKDSKNILKLCWLKNQTL